MHSSDLWQLAQELEVVKWSQSNAVPNSSSLWALAQHVYILLSHLCPLLPSIHRMSLLKLISKAVSILCASTDMTEDSPKFWPSVGSWASHWAPLGHSFPRVSRAMESSGGKSEMWYLHHSEAHLEDTLGSDIIQCTADTQLGQRTHHCPLLYPDGHLARWFLVRMFLTPPGNTKGRRRARHWSNTFLLFKWRLTTSDVGDRDWPAFVS